MRLSEKKRRKRKKRTKAECQIKHAQVRAVQRYNIGCTKADLEQMAQRIQSGDAKFVEKQSIRITVWDLVYEGKTVRVVYDKRRKTIVTFLPMKQVGDVDSKGI